MRRSKYGNKKIQIDGYTFDSLAEGRRYRELKLLLEWEALLFLLV